MKNHISLLNAALAVLLWGMPTASVLAESILPGDDPLQMNEPEKLEFFEKKIRPLLAANCYGCHGPDKQRSDLRLDSRSTMLTGGVSGPVIVDYKPEDSLLIKAIRYEGGVRGNNKFGVEMPPGGKLPDEEITLLTQWVASGAVAPSIDITAKKKKIEDFRKAAIDHWAFQRLKKPTRPEVSDTDGASDPIDQFIQARRQQAGIEPVALADRRTLVRRLYFDLLGLPPTPAQVDAFVAADSTMKVSDLVDELLAQPEFGERWGRYWLDLARYADSNGCSLEANSTYDNAWRYRDYVIGVLNEDIPYDRFVVEQIAGDLLPAVSDTQRCRQLIATGYLVLGPKAFGTGSFEQYNLDTWDEQIDTLGKGLLGISLGCARCHDHKLDPVSTRDYYAMVGIFGSTKSVRRADWQEGKSWNRVPLPMLDAETTAALEKAHEARLNAGKEGPEYEAAKKKVDELTAALEKLKEDKASEEEIKTASDAQRKANRALRSLGRDARVLKHMSAVPAAMAVEELKPSDQAVRILGVRHNKGEVVPRAVLPLFIAPDDERYVVPEGVSGRMQLARWLVDTEGGAGHLLSRVMVNRIWDRLLGRPIVASVNNFGLTGEAPSHPELLEHLAATFVEDGWSIKSLIRRITLTNVYQLSAADNAVAQAIDPGNMLHWRHHPRRLDAEALRDAVLMISGNLDRQRGGKTLQHQGLLAGSFLRLGTPSPYLRRTVYLPIFRSTVGLSAESDDLTDMLATFDFPDNNAMSGRRDISTVPSQSLFLMNSPFMCEQARATAQLLLDDDRFETHMQRIDGMFRRVFCRPVTPDETQQMLLYLLDFPIRSVDTDAEADGESEADIISTETVRLDGWTSLCQALMGSSEFLFLN